MCACTYIYQYVGVGVGCQVNLVLVVAPCRIIWTRSPMLSMACFRLSKNIANILLGEMLDFVHVLNINLMYKFN